MHHLVVVKGCLSVANLDLWAHGPEVLMGNVVLIKSGPSPSTNCLYTMLTHATFFLVVMELMVIWGEAKLPQGGFLKAPPPPRWTSPCTLIAAALLCRNLHPHQACSCNTEVAEHLGDVVLHDHFWFNVDAD